MCLVAVDMTLPLCILDSHQQGLGDSCYHAGTCSGLGAVLGSADGLRLPQPQPHSKAQMLRQHCPVLGAVGVQYLLGRSDRKAVHM